MPESRLTDEEIAWLRANPDVARSVMPSASFSPVVAKVSSSPLEAAAAQFAASLCQRIGKLQSDLERIENRQSRLGKIISQTSGIEEEALAEFRQSRRADEDEAARYRDHIGKLQIKLEKVRSSPSEVFLPLGTVVRFRDSEPYAVSDSYGDRGKSYPMPGSVGVVTGLRMTGEFPIAVSMRDDFDDGWGSSYSPESDRLPTYLLDADQVEIVEHGLLQDGSECLSYGFVPTHTNTDGEREEMIIQASGYFWRLHDFGGTQGVEVLQAYERLAEMAWIGGPIDSAPTPRIG